MSEILVKIALGPLLLTQGLYTRWKTPKLPEAQGERHGRQGSGPALRLLVLGDSAAAGVGVGHQRDALAGQLLARLQATHQVSWRLLARTGATTLDALGWLQGMQPEPFDLAVVSLGVNDVTSSLDAAEWASRQSRLVDLLQGRFAVGRIVLCPVPPMQVFPALPQPLRWFLGVRAGRFNARLAELLASRGDDSVMLQPALEMDGAAMQLMAEDGFHPGALIYSRWAEQIVAGICCD